MIWLHVLVLEKIQLQITLFKYHGIVKRRLAGPIKNAVKELYGFSDEYLETDLKDIRVEKFQCSPREAMVNVTNAIMNVSGIDFFTNRLYDAIGDNEVTIIPDIRY